MWSISTGISQVMTGQRSKIRREPHRPARLGTGFELSKYREGNRLRHFANHQPHFIVLIELSRDRQIAIQQGKSAEYHVWYPAGLSPGRGDWI